LAQRPSYLWWANLRMYVPSLKSVKVELYIARVSFYLLPSNKFFGFLPRLGPIQRRLLVKLQVTSFGLFSDSAPLKARARILRYFQRHWFDKRLIAKNPSFPIYEKSSRHFQRVSLTQFWNHLWYLCWLLTRWNSLYVYGKMQHFLWTGTAAC
jgi:hypothetical protein